MRILLVASATGLAACTLLGGAAPASPRWFKGNLHTHSLWSDGNDYPEMIADRYKQAGYHFLAISDHNVLAEGTRWLALKPPAVVNGAVVQFGGGPVLADYVARFGNSWVEQREVSGKKEVRLKPLAEYRTLLEEPGRFLLIPSAEISATWRRPRTDTSPERGGPVHLNHTNAAALVAPVSADNALEIMQRAVNAVAAQRERTGQPMIVHLNHPNYLWGVTAEELMRVKGEKFFEVYNGHPRVHNDGRVGRLSTDEIWDVVLTQRLAELRLGVMYGIGTDDAHDYHELILGKSNPFRGWIMVRAVHLTPESIIHAMEAGDFYASSGVTLSEVSRAGRTLKVVVEPEPGVTYTTQFIGTRRGYDSSSRVMEDPAPVIGGREQLPHRRYSKDVGAILAEVEGSQASYTLSGEEIYVRAKIISSKEKNNGSVADEVECAWTQPLVNETK